MKFLSAALLVFSILSAAPSQASTVTLLDVTSSFNNGIGGASLGPAGGSNLFGAAQGFTANSDIEDASFTLPFISCTLNCEGRAQLVEVRPNPVPGDINNTVNIVLSDLRFCGTARFGCDEPPRGPNFSPIISGVNLTAGLDYFIALSVISGGGSWLGAVDNADRQVSGTGDISLGGTFEIPQADSSSAFLLSNTLNPIDPTTFLFQINGTVVTPVSTVPLPASGLLFLAALGVLVTRRARG